MRNLIIKVVKTNKKFYICIPIFEKSEEMKEGIHPDSYRTVIFRDMSNGHEFLGKSTANTEDKATFEDGNEYDVIKLDVTNTSHPFFTGKDLLVDTAGRIEKFNKKFGKRKNATK